MKKTSQDLDRSKDTVHRLVLQNEMTLVLDWTQLTEDGMRRRLKPECYKFDGVAAFSGICQALLGVASFCRRHLINLSKTLIDIQTINEAMMVDLTCNICLKVLREPVTFIPCGHTICRRCALGKTKFIEAGGGPPSENGNKKVLEIKQLRKEQAQTQIEQVKQVKSPLSKMTRPFTAQQKKFQQSQGNYDNFMVEVESQYLGPERYYDGKTGDRRGNDLIKQNQKQKQIEQQQQQYEMFAIENFGAYVSNDHEDIEYGPHAVAMQQLQQTKQNKQEQHQEYYRNEFDSPMTPSRLSTKSDGSFSIDFTRPEITENNTMIEPIKSSIHTPEKNKSQMISSSKITPKHSNPSQSVIQSKTFSLQFQLTQCPNCIYQITRGYIRNFIVESMSTREEVKRAKIEELIEGARSLEWAQSELEEQMKVLPINQKKAVDEFEQKHKNELEQRLTKRKINDLIEDS
ncbi:MAG: hypothetical protein EZS28_003308 [Streblomastix strix]|uniref:RING-type domain-containing protein n=1 Tax=Streblomastix strix TaxID=222440 RepID=A0A5J4X1G4_9EUKA|nr:MAG: hypothetical protein EZS28_003308 [Streblomastix strix]